MSIPTDLYGAWRQPADTAQVTPLRPGRHRQAPPVRLTRRGKVLAWIVAGLVSLAAWSGLAWAVWELK